MPRGGSASRPRLYHVLRHGSIFLEVVGKSLCKSLCGFVIRRFVRPGVLRSEYLRGNVRTALRYVYVEQRIEIVFDVIEVTVQRRRDHGSREFEADPLAYAVTAAGPSGVDEEDVGAGAAHALAEHLRINARIEREERSAEAGRERSLRLGDSAFV